MLELPPLTRKRPVPWIDQTLQASDACLFVVDLGDPECVDQAPAIHTLLAESCVTLTERWDIDGVSKPGEDDEAATRANLFAVRLPTLLIANKAERVSALADEWLAFQELTGLRYTMLAASATAGEGLEAIGPWLFRQLGIVRVYTKTPDLNRPFTVRRGQTVRDVARLIRRDLAQSLKYALHWCRDQHQSQQVGPEHPVVDGYILELHG